MECYVDLMISEFQMKIYQSIYCVSYLVGGEVRENAPCREVKVLLHHRIGRDREKCALYGDVEEMYPIGRQKSYYIIESSKIG